MTLRKQLFLVSLLALALPWAGCEYVREIEQVLRQSQVQTLVTSAQTIGRLIENQKKLEFQSPDLFSVERDASKETAAQRLFQPLSLDGYLHDWPVPYHFFQYGPPQRVSLREQDINFQNQNYKKLNVLAAVDHQYAYFYFRIFDGHVVYRSPTGDFLKTEKRNKSDQYKHDQIHLWFGHNNVVLETEAPGSLSVRALNVDAMDNQVDRKLVGQWQDTVDGYNLEFKVPLEIMGNRFGFELIDVGHEPNQLIIVSNIERSSNSKTSKNTSYRAPQNASNIDDRNVPFFVYPQDSLSKVLKEFSSAELRYQVADSRGWIIGDSGRLQQGAQNIEDTHYFLRLMYRTILSDDSLALATDNDQRKITTLMQSDVEKGNASFQWFGSAEDAHLRVAVPLRQSGFIIGSIIALQDSAPILSLTDTALSRLFQTSFMIVFVAAVSLITFATLISFRIRKLRNVVETALSNEGKIDASMGVSLANDEIGDLNRSFSRLLNQLKEYTDYLRSLSSKLSHEIRTPLAIVKSSLENMDQADTVERKDVYALRAQEGVSRLQGILNAMNESTRLEQSISQHEMEMIDLKALLQSAMQAYSDVHENHAIRFYCDLDKTPYQGVPELIMQMLDKLIANAVDFCPLQQNIMLTLLRNRDVYQLVISNDGPLLPETMQDQLFDTLVSIRSGKAEYAHLGLGLYIVRLIVSFHQGSVKAQNRSDHSGVEFVITLPDINLLSGKD